MKSIFMVFLCLFSISAFGKEDFSKYGRGLVVPKGWVAAPTNILQITPLKELPADFDWRTKVTLSPVANQGNCGSCWAFSATSTWMDAMIVQAGEKGDGSFQQTLDCNIHRGYGCNGGMFDAAKMFVSPGANRAAQYGPYQPKQGTCKNLPTFAKAVEWKYISPVSIESIKTALMTYGPVSVGVSAGSDWNSYSGGVLSGSACTSRQLNHAVQIVGWGSSPVGHWIVRNSWGTGFGEGGFIRMAFDCDGIGELPNVIIYKGGQPQPKPEPTPDPQPQPTPCPVPTADTGYGEEFQAELGNTYLMGSKAVRGMTYMWSADPAFAGGAKPRSAQIRYKPSVDKMITLVVTNKCGSSSMSTYVSLGEVSLKKINVYK